MPTTSGEACGKKIRAKMKQERERFVDACRGHRLRPELGNQWFDIIEPFADYAFPKATHSATGSSPTRRRTSRRTIRRSTSPRCSRASRPTSTRPRCTSPTAGRWASRSPSPTSTGRPPTSRRCGPRTTRAGHRSSFGLSAVRNVGEGLVALIVAEREKNGPFLDFYDFCERVDLNVLNKRTIESLIKAGGFDCMGHPRKGLLLAFEAIIDQTMARRRERDMGVMSLFGEVEVAARVRRASEDPRPRVRQVAAAGVREGDARPLRLRSSAARRRRHPAAAAPTGRWPTSPSARTARSRSSAASSPGSSGSGRSGAS